MPTVQQQREKLIGLLKQLFQLDQPELDFGFYRIMHAKAKEVTRFLEQDLLSIIEDAFGDLSTQQVEEKLDAAKRRVVEQLGKEALETDGTLSGMFADTPVGKEYLSAVGAAQAAGNTTTAEGEVYDHLYRFFERYYDSGDFISKRYLTRETSSRSAPYAVPYNGEEVKLHWANSDQYYIKTAEYFANFTFKLRSENEQNPLPVTFKIVDATEGEHGNVKASNGQRRYFILHADDPVSLEDGELIVRFEYRPDPEKTGQEGKWQSRRNEEAEKSVLNALEGMEEAREHLEALRVPAPTNGEKDRTLLGKYIAKYASRNTMDYFIHKDLGGFLRRELDYYIKNEVMQLDDIESADAPRVEQYLSKIKVLRRIAGKLIDFLAQLENFQKKLWLKKKFVVETSYCITLGCVPEKFYVEIAANDAQREEWVSLFSIDEIGPDLNQPGYSVPLKPEFLKAHPSLVLDTRHFPLTFSAYLLETIGNVDQKTDGLMFHAENSQCMRLTARKHRSAFDMLYTDPPYNKRKEDDFAYKDAFQHSSWIAMMYDRLQAVSHQLKSDACLFLSIDDNEFNNLYFVGHNLVGFSASKVVPAITNLKGNQDTEGFASCHEYILAFAKRSLADVGRLPIDEEDILDGWLEDEYGLYRQADGLRATGENAPRHKRPNLWYPIFFEEDGSDFYTTEDDQPKKETHIAIWPINDAGEELSWYWKRQKVNSDKYNLIVKKTRQGEFTLYKKQRPGIGDVPSSKPKSFLYAPEYSSTHGGNLAQDIFGQRMSAFTPKSVALLEAIIHLGLKGQTGTVLDIFGGSGTIGNAVMNLNRADGGQRKFVIVEMGSYFDNVLLPRLKRITFTPEWKDGKPGRFATPEEAERSPRIMKVIRLESYEDTLNNLEFKKDETRLDLLEQNQSLREDFVLHYMLDVETNGSQSLLNIDAFDDPTAYKLKVKRPGSDEYDVPNVDLLETFNYLIGLHVEHIGAPQTFTASFKREPDPELPEDSDTKLILDGRMKQDADGLWWFRTVEGWISDGNGERDRVLIVWRKLTVDIEKDNLMLDEWFKANCISTKDFEYDTIYVNGSNNLPNLKRDEDNWKVRLIEEDFFRLMWDVEDV